MRLRCPTSIIRPRRECRSCLCTLRCSVSWLIRRVSSETCTSGEPVSLSCIRESAMVSVFSSSVNATLVIHLPFKTCASIWISFSEAICMQRWERNYLLHYNMSSVGAQSIVPLHCITLLDGNFCADLSQFGGDLLSLFFGDGFFDRFGSLVDNGFGFFET